jgi:hypothetical protein
MPAQSTRLRIPGVHAVEQQRVEVHVQVQGSTESLQIHGDTTTC